MKNIVLTFLLVCSSVFSVLAQTEIEMATGLRSSGKIWVVVGVVLTLVIGLFIYLFSIDRKVKKLENKN